MGSLTKALIGKEDCSIQTNANATETFSRLNSVGSTINLTKFPDIWDGTGRIKVGQIDNPYTATYYNIPSDGITDSTSYWLACITSMSDGDIIELEPGANYKIDTAGGITFSKKVHINGHGATFTIGTGVGNGNGITVTADDCIIENFTVVGDTSLFTNAIDTVELRRSVSISGDNTIVRNIKFTGGIFALQYNGTYGGSITKCYFKNTIINHDEIATYASQNYCQAIHVTGDCFDLEVEGNYCYGYGEFITTGNRCRGMRISNNVIELQGDNGIYCNGYEFTITGNVIRNVEQAGIKGYYSDTVISNNSIYTTGSYTSSQGIYVHPLNGSVAGQTEDANNNTSYNNVISNNVIEGDFITQGICAAEHPTSFDGFNNITITGNTIRSAATTVTDVAGVVGIVISEGTGNPVSFGIIISNNKIERCFRGITVAAGGTGYHANMEIIGNTMKSIIGNGMNLSYVKESIIADNIWLDPTGTAVTCYGAYLTSCSYNTFRNNFFGNLNSGQADYGFLEVSGNTYNAYVNNRIEGITSYANHYDVDGTTARVIISLDRTRALTGNTTFYQGEGSTLFIDPNGGHRNYNPAGTFGAGYTVTLVNTADAAENLVFDSAGINVTVGQAKCCIFTYTGAAWRQVVAVGP